MILWLELSVGNLSTLELTEWMSTRFLLERTDAYIYTGWHYNLKPGERNLSRQYRLDAKKKKERGF